MKRAVHERLTEQLRVAAAGPVAADGVRAPFSIPADRYRDPAWFEREAALFRAPQIVAASSALAPGSCLPIDRPGRSVIVARDHDGSVHAYANACRHRATRLVDSPCARKAHVCPYHGWTYDLRGTLIHVPHAESFAGQCDGRNLTPVAVEERHGLVWLGVVAGAGTTGVAEYLDAVDGDLASLGLTSMTLWRSATSTRRCNWKLVVEAFLDGYHIRTLHRDSIYRFFIDGASVAEPVGPHVRAVTARRALGEAPASLAGVDLLQLGTPSYLVFPATVIIEHPDFTSVMMLRPDTVDTTSFEHLMFVPAARAGETAHWTKSWELIEDTVFQREDLAACTQIQRGLGAGSDEMLFGALEYAVRFFHDAIAARC